MLVMGSIFFSAHYVSMAMWRNGGEGVRIVQSVYFKANVTSDFDYSGIGWREKQK